MKSAEGERREKKERKKKKEERKKGRKKIDEGEEMLHNGLKLNEIDAFNSRK